jgi:CRISPR-associated endonuclease cas1, NMENI subtype
MSWRTVVITKQSKLGFKVNYMIVRQGFDVKKAFIDEIYMVIIESTAVSLTAVFLNALVKAKVKIVISESFY